MGKIFKIEKGTEKWLGITVILLSIMLVLVSLGKTDLLIYIAGGFSIALALIIFSEAGIREWLKKKGYKRIDFQDILIIMSFIFGTFLIVNAIIIFLGNTASGGFANFIRGSGVVGGTVSGILGIFLLLIKRPRA